MNTKQTIIGLTYSGGLNLVGIDIETETSVNLGRRNYVIVKDPFLADSTPVVLSSRAAMQIMPTEQKLFIDIADELTGRQYRVEFHPGNICEAEQVKQEAEQHPHNPHMMHTKAWDDYMCKLIVDVGGIDSAESIVRHVLAENGDSELEIENMVKCMKDTFRMKGGRHE